MELVYLIAKEHANGEVERKALKELYEMYKAPFYFVAFGMLQNDKKAKLAAAEAFKRIQESAYRFDESLNAQYWFFDVLYTLCANASGTIDSSAECYIKICTELTASEIASITGKKNSEEKKILANEENIKRAEENLLQGATEYWEYVAGNESTGFEEISEKERNKTEKEKTIQKRIFNFKRTIAIVLVVVVACAAVTIGAILITKKFGSDVDKNAVHEDIVLQFNNSIAAAELNGDVYYCGEDAIYKYDTASKKSSKISDDFAKEILSDGTYIYYRNNADGHMYRIDADGSNKTSLCDKPGVAMSIYKGEVYFSSGEGIYKIPVSGAEFSQAELLLDISNDDNLYCVDMEVHSSGKVFFAAGIGKGVHCITDFKGTPSLEGIFADEVYTLKSDGDKLYFDCKEASGKILLYCFDIKEYNNSENTQRVLPTVITDASGKNIELVTGSFEVNNGKIYFAGEENGVSAIYVLGEDKNPIKVTEIPKNEANARKKLVISDLHIFEGSIYYFCSDGKAGGDRAFFEYNMNSNTTNRIF